LAIGLISPILASVLLMHGADLEPLKNSAFGRYVDRYMTRSIEIIRLLGMVVLCLGAWYHISILLLLGVAVILAEWARGKL
jgi:hypothetical protein